MRVHYRRRLLIVRVAIFAGVRWLSMCGKRSMVLEQQGVALALKYSLELGIYHVEEARRGG
jgi:hypothetical protein